MGIAASTTKAEVRFALFACAVPSSLLAPLVHACSEVHRSKTANGGQPGCESFPALLSQSSYRFRLKLNPALGTIRKALYRKASRRIAKLSYIIEVLAGGCRRALQAHLFGGRTGERKIRQVLGLARNSHICRRFIPGGATSGKIPGRQYFPHQVRALPWRRRQWKDSAGQTTASGRSSL